MNFSVTERQNAKRCPRMHRLSSKQGRHLGLIVSPLYLNVGSLIHKGSQSWLLDTKRSASYEDHVTIAAEALIEKAKARYLAQVGAPLSAAEEDELHQALWFARAMAHNYEVRWGSPLPEGFTLIRPEQRVAIPIPGTEHPCEASHGYRRMYPDASLCPKCKSDPSYVDYHYLDGRFDGLIQDPAGRIHVLEHKTYATRPSEGALDRNDQFLAYLWLAIQAGIGDVAGLAYDGLWRRDEVPKGRTFEDLFLRRTIVRTREELLEFGRMLPNELNMMYANLTADQDPYINRRWQGCYDCAFAAKNTKAQKRPGLCDAISENRNVDAVLKMYYTERDDDTEDDDLEPAAE